MRRFFFDKNQRDGNKVVLSSEESRHIDLVLRLQKGEKIELYDGSGAVFIAEIIDVCGRVSVTILERCEDPSLSVAKLVVGQGIIKAKKMELVLQKATELGVSNLFPFTSSRSQGNLVQQYRGKGVRWQKIIDDACKQCKRSKPLNLLDIHSFDDALTYKDRGLGGKKLLFWEKEKGRRIGDCVDGFDSGETVVLLFGPEGGFSEGEVALARHLGWHIVGLGDRILRAETAAITAISIVQYLRGHM